MKTMKPRLFRNLPHPEGLYRGYLGAGVHCEIDASGLPFIWFAREVGGAGAEPVLHMYEALDDGSERSLSIPAAIGAPPRRVLRYPGDATLVVVACDDDPAQQRNATVYGPDGQVRAAFHVGEHIRQIQVDEQGELWVGYTDQGTFGGESALSRKGLVGLDKHGMLLFDYRVLQRTNGLAPLDECTALNVATSREVWIHYWGDYPLVHLVDSQLAGSWDALPMGGARAVAVDAMQALFAGREGGVVIPHHSGRHVLLRDPTLTLFDLVTGESEEFWPVDSAGHVVRYDRYPCAGRGSRLYLRTRQQLLVVDVKDCR